MRLSEIAEKLQRISAARDDAARAIDACVKSLTHSAGAFRRAHLAAKELDDASVLVRSEAGELRELCEHLKLAEEILSEAAFAAASFHNNQATLRVELGSMVNAAQNGMHEKRLAKWEADALREVAVAALAVNPGSSGHK
jgi:hypothetical protein